MRNFAAFAIALTTVAANKPACKLGHTNLGEDDIHPLGDSCCRVYTSDDHAGYYYDFCPTDNIAYPSFQKFHLEAQTDKYGNNPNYVVTDEAHHSWFKNIDSFRAGKKAFCKVCYYNGDAGDPEQHHVDTSKWTCDEWSEAAEGLGNKGLKREVVEIQAARYHDECIQNCDKDPISLVIYDEYGCRGDSKVIMYEEAVGSSCLNYNTPSTWQFTKGQAKSVQMHSHQLLEVWNGSEATDPWKSDSWFLQPGDDCYNFSNFGANHQGRLQDFNALVIRKANKQY